MIAIEHAREFFLTRSSSTKEVNGMDARLEPYRVVVSFLGEALGPDYEVVLHDLTSEDGTIVAIVNNHISGRTEGAPLSNMALRFIQERTVQRIGSNKQKSVDVRIIAATNKNIEQMVKDQQFRSDLYYRLNIIGMTLPPLRERKEDIMPLAQHFIKTISSQYHITAPSVDADVYDVLARYDWPGNVRELRNVVEKLLIMSDGHKITVDSLYTYIFDYDTFNSTKSADNSVFSEKDEISQALSQCRGNVTKAAAMLGITRDTLYRKMKKYDITNRK